MEIIEAKIIIETILLAKQYKLKIAEVPVFANYSLPHTSHKLFGKNTFLFDWFEMLLCFFID